MHLSSIDCCKEFIHSWGSSASAISTLLLTLLGRSWRVKSYLKGPGWSVCQVTVSISESVSLPIIWECWLISWSMHTSIARLESILWKLRCDLDWSVDLWVPSDQSNKQGCSHAAERDSKSQYPCSLTVKPDTCKFHLDFKFAFLSRFGYKWWGCVLGRITKGGKVRVRVDLFFLAFTCFWCWNPWPALELKLMARYGHLTWRRHSSLFFSRFNHR